MVAVESRLSQMASENEAQRASLQERLNSECKKSANLEKDLREYANKISQLEDEVRKISSWNGVVLYVGNLKEIKQFASCTHEFIPKTWVNQSKVICKPYHLNMMKNRGSIPAASLSENFRVPHCYLLL